MSNTYEVKKTPENQKTVAKAAGGRKDRSIPLPVQSYIFDGRSNRRECEKNQPRQEYMIARVVRKVE